MSTAPPEGPPGPSDIRYAIAATGLPGPAALAAIRLGEALRALNRAVVGSMAPDALLDEVAVAVRGLADRLAPHARTSRYPQADAISGEGTFANHPMIGRANPCAPPIAMRVDGDRLVGDITFGTPQEGPPGCAYGGYLAAGFDAILLMTAGINGLAGPTKSLAVRYRRPTPLHAPIHYMGEVNGVEERVVRVRGALVDDEGTVYVEGAAEVARGARIGHVADGPPRSSPGEGPR
jgi:hypothetical protein